MIPIDKQMTFPEQVVTFPIYQDVTSSDGEYIKQYLNAIENHNYLEAGVSLSKMQNYTNKILTTRDWQLMYDTVKSVENMIEDFSSGSSVGSNLTKYYIGDTNPRTGGGQNWVKGDYWIDTSLQLSPCDHITVTSSETQFNVGGNYIISGIVYSSATQAGKVQSPVEFKLTNSNGMCKICQNYNSSVYRNTGAFQFILTPLKAGNCVVQFLCDGKKVEMNYTFKKVSSIDIDFIGFSDSKFLFSHRIKNDGTTNSLKKRKSTIQSHIGVGRTHEIIFKKEYGWPILVKSYTEDGNINIKDVSSELVPYNNITSAKEYVSYSFIPTSAYSIELIPNTDQRRQPESDDYIGYYSAEDLILIDTTYVRD